MAMGLVGRHPHQNSIHGGALVCAIFIFPLPPFHLLKSIHLHTKYESGFLVSQLFYFHQLLQIE
jgi:hypothetical protein